MTECWGEREEAVRCARLVERVEREGDCSSVELLELVLGEVLVKVSSRRHGYALVLVAREPGCFAIYVWSDHSRPVRLVPLDGGEVGFGGNGELAEAVARQLQAAVSWWSLDRLGREVRTSESESDWLLDHWREPAWVVRRKMLLAAHAYAGAYWKREWLLALLWAESSTVRQWAIRFVGARRRAVSA